MDKRKIIIWHTQVEDTIMLTLDGYLMRTVDGPMALVGEDNRYVFDIIKGPIVDHRSPEEVRYMITEQREEGDEYFPIELFAPGKQVCLVAASVDDIDYERLETPIKYEV